MNAPAALSHLVRSLRHCAPTVRDQLTAGTLDEPRRALEEAAGPLPFTDAQLSAAVHQWVMDDADDETFEFAVFLAARQEIPVAHVVSVIERIGRPGVYLVEVDCPYAHLHTYRPRGHHLHTHGWAKSRAPGVDGSIGMRVPHCEGATRGREILANYELVLPPHLRRPAS